MQSFQSFLTTDSNGDYTFSCVKHCVKAATQILSDLYSSANQSFPVSKILSDLSHNADKLAVVTSATHTLYRYRIDHEITDFTIEEYFQIRQLCQSYRILDQVYRRILDHKNIPLRSHEGFISYVRAKASAMALESLIRQCVIIPRSFVREFGDGCPELISGISRKYIRHV
ncbi:hypothetical protein ACI2KR_27295 [Pseudomonas luteola]